MPKTPQTNLPTGAAKSSPAHVTFPPSGARVYADPKAVTLDQSLVTDGELSDYKTNITGMQPIPPPRVGASLIMNLSDVLGDNATNAIEKNGQIVFHSVGDTGADKPQRVAYEDSVANMMANDLNTLTGKEQPSFFYHLGDVVYEFGQADSYYGQFYEPYSQYNAPIFAIPGNHDGMVYSKTMKSLAAFLDNFCAPAPGTAENAGGLSRTTMNQPGVYFTLACPFVNIIGLYSNISDGGTGQGVISSENGTIPGVTDVQKDFLIAELQRLKPIRESNGTAVILAVHHPAFRGNDAAVNTLGKDLDDAFTKGQLWPDVVISGHDHVYERFERDIPATGIKMPYIVAGCGGYNTGKIGSDPNVKVPASLKNNPGVRAYVNWFGYLKIKVTQNELAIVYNCTRSAYGPAADSIVIDLKTHSVKEYDKADEPELAPTQP